jgi:hypothetical protein
MKTDGYDVMLVEKDGQEFWCHPSTYERIKRDGYKPVDARRNKRRIGKSFNEVLRGDEATAADEKGKADDVTGNDHHASKVADLLVESGAVKDRADALTYLLHHKDGQALLSRMKKGDTTTMTRQEHLRDIAKNYGPIRLAKLLVEDQDAHGIGEDELTDLIGKHDPKPGESTAQTFVRHYTAQTSDGMALRKAMAIAKEAASLTPLTSGGLDDQRAAINDTESSAAYQQLVELAEAQRASAPFLSTAQAFERAFKANPELAAKAHRRPTPPANGAYEFPRKARYHLRGRF